MKMLTTKYDGKSGVREHIMTVNDMATKLKGMDMEISEGFLVRFIMTSLPMEYGPFKINYNTQKEKCSTSEITCMCVQEEERLKVERIDYAHLTSINSGKRKSQCDGKPKKKMNISNIDASKLGTSGTKVIPTEPKGPKCHFCKEDGHVMKECDGFKAWLAKKGIPFHEDIQKDESKSYISKWQGD
ncbi:unnamed protein product [Triticum aestivum]|uniref:Uncharacterized protein n=1 Tax=Triticum aestivum TaxID=4565 RepID=A0A7H4LBG0_WHEAT|nr:unnamed protein product [Triticum aestivum]